MVSCSDNTMVARYKIDAIAGNSILHKLGGGMAIEICSKLSDIFIGKSGVSRCFRSRCNRHAKGALLWMPELFQELLVGVAVIASF